jgi:hypothetical protein
MADTKATGSGHTVHAALLKDETEGQAIARTLMDPCTRHAFTTLPFISANLDKSVPMPAGMDFVDGVKRLAADAEAGNLSFVSLMLAVQAKALDAVFGEFARRSSLNMGNHLDATERYARLALKAQANSRATLEALAKLHQPREQIVRHVHVNEGGQAIVADQVNHYAGGARNAEPDKQSHAAGALGGSSPMPCPHPAGRSVPVPNSEGAEAMPDARRHKPRRT